MKAACARENFRLVKNPEVRAEKYVTAETIVAEAYLVIVDSQDRLVREERGSNYATAGGRTPRIDQLG